MCFKNSVHLGAEKYLHMWNAGAKYFCCAGQWEKKLFGKDLVVLSINLSQALNVINMLQNIKIKSKNKNMFFQRAAILGNYRRYSQDFLQFIHVMEQWFMRESKITQAHCEM